MSSLNEVPFDLTFLDENGERKVWMEIDIMTGHGEYFYTTFLCKVKVKETPTRFFAVCVSDFYSKFYNRYPWLQRRTDIRCCFDNVVYKKKDNV